MPFLRVLALLVAGGLVGGCASVNAGRAYAPRDGMFGLGYSELKMSADTWRVTFAGYSISGTQAHEYALLRACEITQAAGFPFMELIDETASTRNGGGVAYTLSPQMAIGMPVVYPTANVGVRGVKEKTSRSVESAPIAAQIRARYKLRI